MSAELLRRHNELPPRTRAIIELACDRPELSLVEIAGLCGIAVSNLRCRLKTAYSLLGVEGRVELVARLRPALATVPVEP